MRPRPFEYFRPDSAEEAVDILSRQDEDARCLAGGQSLVPLMNLRMAAPTALIDLNACSDLDYIEVDGDSLVLGAMVRQARGAEDALVLEHCPLVAEALRLNGHSATRHRGTVGGTLAHADSLAELPGVAVALDAELVLQGRDGRRSVSAHEFFLGPLVTGIEPGEMLREVRFPISSNLTRSWFLESGIRSHDFAIAGVGACLEIDGRSCRRARLAAVGVGPVPFRLATLEAALVADGIDEALVREAIESDLAEIEVIDNPHASGTYRRRLLEALARRVVREALDSTQRE